MSATKCFYALLCRSAAERARSNLQLTKDQELGHQRTMENELHDLQLKNSELRSKVKERESLQASISNLRREIEALQIRVKVGCLLSNVSSIILIRIPRNWRSWFKTRRNHCARFAVRSRSTRGSTALRSRALLVSSPSFIAVSRPWRTRIMSLNGERVVLHATKSAMC